MTESFLEKVSRDPAALKKCSPGELASLAAEMRTRMVETISRTGGHLASNLGIVELTLALHRVFSFPPDGIVWDVGHQAYPHKLLTGRAGRFATLRQEGGLSGFPDPAESDADLFRTGHAGAAVSSATGLALGREFLKTEGSVIAVIGDGSLTNGVTFEGLNFLGHSRKKNPLVILNDNGMSISPTRGALSFYLARLTTSPRISKPREDLLERLRRIPTIGEDLVRIATDVEKRAKYLVVPGVFFEKLGFKYLGPIDGHDIEQMEEILRNLRDVREPILLHVVTKKGKGYAPAEEDPSSFHGAGRFTVATGTFNGGGGMTPGRAAGEELGRLAAENPRLVVITAAMEKGLGLEKFAARYPDRFFDVGISESHAVILAAGLARTGMNVVVAIYSTFFQRAYDQLFHDICLQNLPVVFLVDRAGLVGEDGPTHHGVYDLSFPRSLPGMTMFAPVSLDGLRARLRAALAGTSPAVIRYPRSFLPDTLPASFGPPTARIVLFGTGSCGETVIGAARLLEQEGIIAAAHAVEGVKPLPAHIFDAITEDVDFLATVEENSMLGGFGSAVLEEMNDSRRPVKVLRCGIPDEFIPHATRSALLDRCGLTAERIAERVRAEIQQKKD